MSPRERWLVVGSTSTLTTALRRQIDGPMTVVGRSPVEATAETNFVHIGSLESTGGQLAACAELHSVVSRSEDVTHSVFLQGLSTADWDLAVAVNLVSVGRMCEAVLDARPPNGSSITLVGSASSYLGGKMAYAASKAGLSGVMAAINKMASGSVRCNLVVPGAFESSMIADWSVEKRQQVSDNTTLRRLANSDEIAAAIISLATNRYATGTVLNMTGGQVPRV